MFCLKNHNYDTVSSSADKLIKLSYRNNFFGKKTVIIGAINYWNKTKNILKNQALKSLHPNKIKTSLTKRSIDK